MTSFSIFNNIEQKSRKVKVNFLILLKILWKMEHLLSFEKYYGKLSICVLEQVLNFHNIFKYIVFQRRQNGLSWSKGLMNGFKHMHLRVIFSFTHPFYRILTDWVPL